MKVMEAKIIQYKKYLILSFIVLSILAILFGLMYFFLFKPEPESHKEEEEIAQDEVITFSTDSPSEEKIPEDYAVQPENPREIILPTINAKGFIQQVGIDQNNEIAVPNNINMTGWYINSVKPGEMGLSIIDGHVDGVYSDGVFFSLKNLEKDDLFTVIYGNGSELNFKVIDIIEVDVEDAAEVLYKKEESIVSQLNLITCIGNYDSTDRSYDKRLIVASERVE